MAKDAHTLARSVRSAQRRLGSAPGETRRSILLELASLLEGRQTEILEANEADLRKARAENLAAPLVRRLELSEAKLQTLGEGIAHLAEANDLIGRAVRKTELDHDLILQQVWSPIGVILVIFESRPDAVIQIGSLALRTGNGVLLKGGSEALASNRVLVDCLRDAIRSAGLSGDAVCGVEGREVVGELLDCPEEIDLIIPRGSGELVRSIQSSTRIPVLGHSEGICHLYIDAEADTRMAIALSLDGKCTYPAACNATESLLVHRDFLPQLGAVSEALRQAGVEIRADPVALPHCQGAVPATEADQSTEYGDLILAIRIVDSIEQAIDHINRLGSSHTDSIVSSNQKACDRFLAEVDSASVFANASTRFADGYRYGLGAEVGISTGRIHARGPVGVEGLLTTRWLLRGSGHKVGDYGPGKRSFTHRTLPIE